MVLFRKFVSVFGVALCVAPMFILFVAPSAAQQGNEQSQVLFQLQRMQQEIAELRDMVERQNYQIKQLQRSKQQTGPQSNQNFNQPTVNQPTTVSGESYPPYQVASPQVPLPNGEQGQEQGAVILDQDGSPVYSDAQTPPIFNDSQQEVENYPPSVEERSIDQPEYDDQSGYPPVEERTIGAPDTSESVPEYDPETYNQDVQVESQSEYPAPYQRQIPARAPSAENVLGNASATGAVIAVPGTVAGVQESADVEVDAKTGQGSISNTVLSEQDYYTQGVDLLKQSKHDEAVSLFKRQISNYPNGDYADGAHYWIAESMYVNRDLEQSKLYFKSIIDRFAQSPRLPDAMLKTAYIEQEQGNRIEARILLQEIIQFHPRSNAAIAAKNRLADID